VVEEIGPDVESVAVGDEVIGWTDQRASHAELVVVPVEHLVARPAGVSWEAGGALFVAGTTAFAAVRAVGVTEGDIVVVSGAAGGVGSLAVQLASRLGAKVIGLASSGNHEWLRDHGVTPVAYGDGVADRIREASGGRVDAFIDTFGGGYVRMAIEELGVAPDRVDTIIDRGAAQEYGAKMEGTAAAATAEVMAELAHFIDRGELEVPIAKVFPLTQVRDAFGELERRHTRGKIVLKP
jgi:NADPH:quinone reductase-like Zn-dependent oxidoreductase